MNDQTNADMGVNMHPNQESEAVVSGDCPTCGMPKEEWRGGGGEGFQMGARYFCCQGCATETGCTCR